jgi:hypothetical protein
MSALIASDAGGTPSLQPCSRCTDRYVFGKILHSVMIHAIAVALGLEVMDHPTREA